MKLTAIRDFIDSSVAEDQHYVARRANITREYLIYSIATGWRVPSEQTAAKIEVATIAVNKRKPHVKIIRCTDLIADYKRCPHDIEINIAS